MKGPLTIYNPSFSSLDIRSDRLTGTIGGFRFLDSTASNAASIYAYTQGVLSLQTLGNERARLDENGNFLLGDVLTGGAIVNPKIALNADGSATFANDVETAGVFISDRASAGATVFGGRENGVTKTQIYANGNATFAGTVTATVVPPSDARFKENITPAKPQLADVVALGGLLKNYDWTDEAPLNEELRSVRQLGLVAQEVAEVCPSLVKDINRTKTMEITPAVIGPKGRVITEAVTEEVDDSYKGLSQEALIMKLIGAVAELSAEVASLRSN
jgi:hypothetical protein